MPGVRTFPSRHMAVTDGLLVEAIAWRSRAPTRWSGSISEGALLITPVHQAAGRLREMARGFNRRHGSCGVGMGEAVADALKDPDAPRMRDLRDRRALRRKLAENQARKRDELAGILRDGPVEERRWLFEPGLLDDWTDAAVTLPGRLKIVEDSALGECLKEETVFEGAQGVLLDEWHGFHPYTTWSTCTFDNALELLKEQGYAGPVKRLGVLRSFMIRHGPGPFPTEDLALNVLPEPHNGNGLWQGKVRRGWLDFPLLRYALAACGGADGLALTHLDVLPRLQSWRAAMAYENCSFSPSFGRDLAVSGERTRRLAQAMPHYGYLYSSAPKYMVRRVESLLGVPVAMTSSGPTAKDLIFLGS